MEQFYTWLSGMEFSAIHIVTIVIFAIYILASSIGFVLVFAMGRGYMDLAKGLQRILQRQVLLTFTLLTLRVQKAALRQTLRL